VNPLRIRDVNGEPLRGDGEWVLYWMTSARRRRSNPALERAVEHASTLGRPLVVLEALRSDYPYASHRFHRFILDGMADNAGDFAGTPVRYYPYVEREPGGGKGLLAALAARACVVVTDDWPSFFHPRMLAAAANLLDVRLEAVDGNGLLPLASTDRVFTTAHSFRRVVQKTIRPHLFELPREDPLADVALPPPVDLPDDIATRWPADPAPDLTALPLDREVAPTGRKGGSAVARAELRRFVETRLARYAEDRNRPEEVVTSGLSPYLHFGHVSSFEVFHAIAEAEGWTPDRLGEKTDGSRAGWWGMSESAEAFLDQVVTWRELGFHTSAKLEGYDRYETLPPWALTTLAEHAPDTRTHLYALAEFEEAATHDPLWNAAQRQLRTEGIIHNYLRMLWGKKILEWSRTPEEALAIMLHLNDRWALDGRDPNSVSGIFWCLGRYDRAWGPVRPVFGKVRYMSSENTARKVRVRDYIERFGGDDSRPRPRGRGRS